MPDVPSESEIKIILGKEETERLRARLGEPVQRLRQVNHYYETPENHLARARVSLRLREETEVGTPGRAGDGAAPAAEAPRFLLTVKEAGLRAGALMVRPELESELDGDAWAALRGGSTHFAELDLPPIHRLREAVDGFPGLALAELGTVKNLRDVFGLEDESIAMEILLDRTAYPDGSQEFELECELPQADAGRGARVLRGLFDELDIDWRPSQVGKYVRFRRKIGRAAEGGAE